jgi:hypothetical protein
MIGLSIARPAAGCRKRALVMRALAMPVAAAATMVAMLAISVAAAVPASAAPHHRPGHRLASHHAVHRAARQWLPVTLSTLVSGIAVHSRPTMSSGVTGMISRRGTRVTIDCYVTGSRIAGNPVWYHLSDPVAGFLTSYFADSHYDPVAGLRRCPKAKPRARKHRRGHADTQFSRTYRTLVTGVHIRYWPTALAARLDTLGRVGSQVTVNCYVLGELIGKDDVWYHVTSPVTGFISGSHLNTGRDPAYGIPACW